MSNAIEQLKSGTVVGYAGFGYRSGVAGSVRQQVHDGDTINVRATGNFGVRFLGVDAPEISFRLPGESRFTSLSSSRWETFLEDPFADGLPPFDPQLDEGLMEHLQARTRAGTAKNQYNHAAEAEDALEEEVRKDLTVLGETEEDFKFFLAFAYEVMDRYGRFLCFTNRYQPDSAEQRPHTYNERLLEAGRVSPYFIWPNINPFRKEESIVKAVDSPGKFRARINGDKTLRSARKWVKDARRRNVGIFDAKNPLELEPFEVRYMARRHPPDRWIIDLSKSDGILINPQAYYTVPDIEDRLFIPEEYVPLFVEKGWRRE